MIQQMTKLLTMSFLIFLFNVGNLQAQKRLTGPKFKNTPTHKRVNSKYIVTGNKLNYKGPSAKTPIHKRTGDTSKVDIRREKVIKGPKAKQRKAIFQH